MKHENVYKLSAKNGPPRINLRDAEIMDSYGDESFAKRLLNHKVPEDVTREDFDYYGWIYAFLKFNDLLFYLYPMAAEFNNDCSLDAIDPFLYSLDRFIPAEYDNLDQLDQEALLDGLRWMLNAHPLGNADWVQCPNIQNLLGINVTWDDI